MVLIVLSLCLFAGGCSTFDRDWGAMTESPPPPPGSVNGHTGGLRCIVTPDETETVQARFHASCAGCMTFEYTVPVTVRQEGEVCHFTGGANLGWLAGDDYKDEELPAIGRFRNGPYRT